MTRTLPKQKQQKICWEINFQTAFELFLLVRTIIKGNTEVWITSKHSLNQIRQKFPQRKNLLMPWWKPLPMTGEVYGRWCGKTATRPTTVQGARKERFYLSSGTPVALFALYRFGGPPVWKRPNGSGSLRLVREAVSASILPKKSKEYEHEDPEIHKKAHEQCCSFPFRQEMDYGTLSRRVVWNKDDRSRYKFQKPLYGRSRTLSRVNQHREDRSH